MNNIKLFISYDGDQYLGWQKTSNGRSIEGTLQKTLKQILQHDITLQAASRTDAGVHALEQVVNFFTPKSLDFAKVFISLNQLLPKDIRLLHIEKATLNFHPTLDAKGKIYRYKVFNKTLQCPFQRKISWHYPTALSLETMRQAAKFFIGKKDFVSFSNTRKPPHLKTICEIFSLDIYRQGDFFDFVIQGDRFLYKMARNLVGTLVYIGANKLTPEDVILILEKKKRELAGITAPAHGLFLEKVIYF